MNSIQILEKLISFNTVSSNSNLDIISYCEKILKDAGAKITLIKNKKEKNDCQRVSRYFGCSRIRQND